MTITKADVVQTVSHARLGSSEDPEKTIDYLCKDFLNRDKRKVEIDKAGKMGNNHDDKQVQRGLSTSVAGRGVFLQ